MTAIAGTVATEKHSLAAEHPSGAYVAVSALRKVVNFALSIGLYQGYVRTVPAANADIR